MTPKRARELLLLEIDRLQVAQHARQDLLLVGRHQPARHDGARHLAALHFAQPLLQVLQTQRDAAAVGIQDHHALLELALDQEVPGKAHPLERQSGTATDLDVQHRQADGDTDTPLQHFVEKAVAWVVVVLQVGREAFFLEQEPVEAR